MKKTKIMTVVGTRPEIIRLSRVINKLDEYVEHILIHTGQNYDYELNKVFFEDLELSEPEEFLSAADNSPSAASTVGRIIEKVDIMLEKYQPDALLILGDTNSCLSAIPAKKRKIPIFHMEAGNRCFDMRVPEETNRKIVDHIADINMPYSSIAREYLLREGIAPDRIVKTGSPMYEVLKYYQKKIDRSDVLSRLKLTKNNYFVVSFHREENVESDKNLYNFIETLNRIAEVYSCPILISTHPRTRKRLINVGAVFNQKIIINKPLGFLDYIYLQKNAKIVLSDSGTITEESSILNFPALNIREAHERPEGMEEATVIMSGLQPEKVLESINITLKQHNNSVRLFREVSDYTVPNVSEKVIRIILSYIDYVNSNVWNKENDS